MGPSLPINTILLPMSDFVKLYELGISLDSGKISYGEYVSGCLEVCPDLKLNHENHLVVPNKINIPNPRGCFTLKGFDGTQKDPSS